MADDSHFRFDNDDNEIKYEYSQHHQVEMGKPKTQAHIYCINDNWQNELYLKQTLDRIHLTDTLFNQCIQISLHKDDNELHSSNANKTPAFTGCVKFQAVHILSRHGRATVEIV